MRGFNSDQRRKIARIVAFIVIIAMILSIAAPFAAGYLGAFGQF